MRVWDTNEDNRTYLAQWEAHCEEGKERQLHLQYLHILCFPRRVQRRHVWRTMWTLASRREAKERVEGVEACEVKIPPCSIESSTGSTRDMFSVSGNKTPTSTYHAWVMCPNGKCPWDEEVGTKSVVYSRQTNPARCSAQRIHQQDHKKLTAFLGFFAGQQDQTRCQIHKPLHYECNWLGA
jgi:hypothetical protein